MKSRWWAIAIAVLSLGLILTAGSAAAPFAAKALQPADRVTLSRLLPVDSALADPFEQDARQMDRGVTIGPASTATVSGTIRHDGSPVAGVVIQVMWDSGEDTITTNGSGTYIASGIAVGSSVRISVRPPLAMQLQYRDWYTGSLNGDQVVNFDLVSGYRLQVAFRQPDGTPYTTLTPQIKGIGLDLPAGEFLSLPYDGSGQWDTVLAPGFYAILCKRDSSQPYYMPPTIIDLRLANATGQVVTLLDRPLPWPEEPPLASLIAVGAPDDEGYATVTGQPGAVPPLVAVMVVNLNANTLAVTGSDATGAFSAQLYAPPGSSVLVKYDPFGENVADIWAWAQTTDKETAMFVQNLPGTILYAQGHAQGGDAQQAFDYVGKFGWWSGWWISGTIQTPSGTGLAIQPGQTFTVTARLLATSPAMACSGIPTYTINGNVRLAYLFAEDGRPMSVGNWFTSFLFTPTGLPIEHEAPEEFQELEPFVFTDLTCVSEHALEARLSAAFTVPGSLSPGVYLPKMVIVGDVPNASNVPSLAVWFHDAELAVLPPIRVGSPSPSHIPWTLLGDYAVNGYRGLQARQDVGIYALPTRVRTAPYRVVIPRLNERSGEPLRYRLEPGSYWVSGTERRTPCPPKVQLAFPGGELVVEILKPDGGVDTLGPASILQSSVRTPSLPDRSDLDEGTGYIGDIFHLATLDDDFAYHFEQYGAHVITVTGHVSDIYGNVYPIHSTYDVTVARVLDLDPAQLPTTPYEVGDMFAPGLHIFPPFPAQVNVQLVHMPFSNPAHAVSYMVSGPANRFGYFQPPLGNRFGFEVPGEFRVDILAVYTATDGTVWAGATTWGNVVESPTAPFEVHGRRGMDYKSDTIIDTMPSWFTNAGLPSELVGIEDYYPYFSGDVLWGSELETLNGGDSLHTILTVRDLTGPSEEVYSLLRQFYPRARAGFRRPPTDNSLAGLEQRFDIGEAPLFITTRSGIDPVVAPDDIDFYGYWYGSSERPDVHVREIISEDSLGTAYWRYHDTYGYQIGEPADGDQPGDIKWNFGGVVFRVLSDTHPVNEYGIYGSFWVLLPHSDPVGPRVTPPFQDGLEGISINGGPILTMTVDGEVREIDMLFLPKSVRPGDVLEQGDVIAFSGHVGPPLDSLVSVTITSPSNVLHTAVLSANKIGWIYDPDFNFVADEPGRWTVDVHVVHDRALAYALAPTSHNTGTVMGTTGRYEFYVVDPDVPRLFVTAPEPGFITWPASGIEPVHIRGYAPAGTTEVRYTIHDKGVVMGQGGVTPDASGAFTVTYDAEALHQSFSMLSLTAREGRWEGLADEVAINLLAIGGSELRANTVTLIGEEVFIGGGPIRSVYLPVVLRNW
jgi:hypothetical protein